MNLVLLSLLLSCPKTIVENTTTEAWNAHDEQTLVYAKKRCQDMFEDAPCLKRFVKYNTQQYTATCGKN